jgi:hypothetical protein
MANKWPHHESARPFATPFGLSPPATVVSAAQQDYHNSRGPHFGTLRAIRIKDADERKHMPREPTLSKVGYLRA